MQANFKKINDYFQSLVTNTNHIKKFVSVSKRELQNVLAKSPKEEDPFFVFFGYEGKLDGNNQRTFGTRTISFAIVFRVSDANDYANQYKRINDAEEIGLQVLSRINQDSHPSSTVTWLHNSFRKDSVRFSEVTYQTPSGLFGCEFHFDLEVKNPLTAKSDFWLDKDFCNS